MPSNHLMLYCSLVLLPSIFPSIRVFWQEFWLQCLQGTIFCDKLNFFHLLKIAERKLCFRDTLGDISKVMHAQLCPTLCHPVDCSLPGSSVHGIVQERILERVAIFFSRVSSWLRDQTCVSCFSCIGRQSDDRNKMCSRWINAQEGSLRPFLAKEIALNIFIMEIDRYCAEHTMAIAEATWDDIRVKIKVSWQGFLRTQKAILVWREFSRKHSNWILFCTGRKYFCSWRQRANSKSTESKWL